jgi:hypothetical protein
MMSEDGDRPDVEEIGSESLWWGATLAAVAHAAARFQWGMLILANGVRSGTASPKRRQGIPPRAKIIDFKARGFQVTLPLPVHLAAETSRRHQ